MIVHTLKNLSPSSGLTLLEQGMSLVSTGLDFNNYHPSKKDHPANIFHLLQVGRFTFGNYFVIEENGNYVGSAGWNKYDDTTALCFVRAYISKEHRNRFLLSSVIFPLILKETVNFEKLWITCNEHNKIIYNGLTRETSLWPKVYSCFKPIGQHMVNHTLQYVAEYKLDRKTYDHTK